MRTSIPDIYILTDARGFTTLIMRERRESHYECAMRESARCNLLAPIQVVGWVRAGGTWLNFWRKVEEFTWTGGMEPWL